MGGRGGIAGDLDVVAGEGGLRGAGVDEVAHGELVEGREVGADFFPAAAGEEGDPGLVGVEAVLGGVGFARDGGGWEFGEGVAYELGLDVAGLVEGLLEGEDDEHAVYAFLDPAEAGALPGPELGADEPDHGDACVVEVLGEAEVYVGEVDEDGDVWAGSADAADEFAVAGVDVGDVAEDFGDAHDGYVFGADDAVLACGLHLGSAEAGVGGVG